MRLASRVTVLWVLFLAGAASIVTGFVILYRFARVPRAEQSCVAALGALGFTGLGFLMMVAMLVLVPWASRTIWEGEAAGHRIRIVNHALREALIIDDQLVAEHRGLSFGTTLRASQPLQVEAKIGGLLYMTCRCTVEGQQIPLTEVR